MTTNRSTREDQQHRMHGRRWWSVAPSGCPVWPRPRIAAFCVTPRLPQAAAGQQGMTETYNGDNRKRAPGEWAAKRVHCSCCEGQLRTRFSFPASSVQCFSNNKSQGERRATSELPWRQRRLAHQHRTDDSSGLHLQQCSVQADLQLYGSPPSATRKTELVRSSNTIYSVQQTCSNACIALNETIRRYYKLI